MHLDINGLITQYGYLALFIGCIAEGETFLLLGGVAAHEGLLHYSGVVLAAMAGGVVGDQMLYWIGRRFGTRILRRFKKHQDKVVKANRLIKRRPSLFVIGARFMYGFRIIGPIIIGASRLKPLKFFSSTSPGRLSGHCCLLRSAILQAALSPPGCTNSTNTLNTCYGWARRWSLRLCCAGRFAAGIITGPISSL